MEDIDFILLVSYIYQNKSFSSLKTPIDESTLSVSEWLKYENQFQEDKYIDPSHEVTIDLVDNETNEYYPRIIDILNIYNPSIPIKFILHESNDNLLTKRLKMDTFRKITYKISGNWKFELGCIHGGEIHIDGYVGFPSLFTLIKDTPSKKLMRSSIHVKGMIQDFTNGDVNKLFDNFLLIIGDCNDDDMIGFQLTCSVSIPQVENRKYYIRSWLIQVENNNVFKFTVAKIHNLQ